MKKFLIAAVFILFLTFQTFINTSTAAELSDQTRTLTLDDDGKEVVVSIKEYTKGKRLFNDVCAQCHAGGITKTNPDVFLFATEQRLINRQYFSIKWKFEDKKVIAL